MSWVALLLIGFAITDLTHSVRHVPRVPEYVGAVAVVVVAAVTELWRWPDVLAVIVIVAAVIAWGRTVSRGFGSGPAWLPLVVFGSALLLALLCTPLAASVGDPMSGWLDATPFSVLGRLSGDRALLVVAGLLLQMSTGNVLVRLVLAASGTISPLKQDVDSMPETQLKGGRLLGPMERLVIVGLGLAGQLTAASIVIAAKGLLRFPELTSRREQEQIHRLTEYFLVGSFVSWLIALGTLVLVG